MPKTDHFIKTKKNEHNGIESIKYIFLKIYRFPAKQRIFSSVFFLGKLELLRQ